MPIAGFGPSGAQTFADSFILAAGDTIDFSVGNSGLFDFNDSTGIAAVVTSVSEAGTFTMLFAGLAGLFGATRRRPRVSTGP